MLLLPSTIQVACHTFFLHLPDCSEPISTGCWVVSSGNSRKGMVIAIGPQEGGAKAKKNDVGDELNPASYPDLTASLMRHRRP